MSDWSTYKPQERALPAKVLAFFVENPEEALASADIALKWDVKPAGSVSSALAPVVKMGLLASSRVGHMVHYTAGEHLMAWAGYPRTEPRQAATRLVPSVPIGALEIHVTLRVHGAGTPFQRVEVVGVEP